MPQLEADVGLMRRMLAVNEIDNSTFQKQRDHMLIQARGGPTYGAQGHAHVKGRSKDPEKDARMAKWLEEADTPKWR